MKTWNRTARTTVMLAALALSAAIVVTGCGSSRSATLGEPGFSLRPSAKQIVAGERVTVTTRSENLAGTASEIQWSSTGGKLTTERNGQVARVEFDHPGTYVISATLSVDGQPVETDSVNVKVTSLSGE